MRVLLLLALMLRLVPTPAWGEHCSEGSAERSVAAHAHHDAQATDDAGECSHCPPSECAAQHGCTVSPPTLAITATSAVQFWASVSSPASRAPKPLRSQPASPPVPPPVIHSA